MPDEKQLGLLRDILDSAKTIREYLRGVSRTLPAKTSAAGPLLSSSTLRSQFGSVPQSLLAPPPSHTRLVNAASSPTLSVPLV